MTFTDGLRHVHIYTPGAEGGLNTTSHAAEYDLDDTRYTQTTLYSVTNDEVEGGCRARSHPTLARHRLRWSRDRSNSTRSAAAVRPWSSPTMG